MRSFPLNSFNSAMGAHSGAGSLYLTYGKGANAGDKTASHAQREQISSLNTQKRQCSMKTSVADAMSMQGAIRSWRR